MNDKEIVAAKRYLAALNSEELYRLGLEFSHPILKERTILNGLFKTAYADKYNPSLMTDEFLVSEQAQPLYADLNKYIIIELATALKYEEAAYQSSLSAPVYM